MTFIKWLVVLTAAGVLANILVHQHWSQTDWTGLAVVYLLCTRKRSNA